MNNVRISKSESRLFGRGFTQSGLVFAIYFFLLSFDFVAIAPGISVGSIFNDCTLLAKRVSMEAVS